MGSQIKRMGAWTVMVWGLIASSSCASGGGIDDEEEEEEEEEVDSLELAFGWGKGPRLGHHPGHGHHDPRDRSSCAVSVAERIARLELKVSSHDVHGVPVELVSVRELNMTVPGHNVFSESVTVRLRGGRELLSYETRMTAGGPIQGSVEWNRMVRGADSMQFSLQGDVLSGSVDGRAFTLSPADADPRTAVFADGRPPPRLKTSKAFSKAVRQLGPAVDRALGECDFGPLESLEPAITTLQSREPDPGHFSDTYDTLECDGCKALALAIITAGDVGCCLGTFGFACGLCIALTPAAVVAGIGGCETSNACCPVACGDGIGATCCFGDETCLNGATGRCCSAGQQTCAGLSCCDADESCIDGGPNKGTCCPDAFLCGMTCCADVQVCVNAGQGLCCLASNVCGDECCESGEVCENDQCVEAGSPELPSPQACAEGGRGGVPILGEDALGIPCRQDADCPCRSPAPGDDPACGICSSNCCIAPPP
jgi:hypothetical protein